METPLKDKFLVKRDIVVRRRVTLPFIWSVHNLWSAESLLHFKARGLLYWGPDNASLIVYMDGKSVASANYTAVPARFFNTAKNFEQVVKQWEADGREVPAWVEFPLLQPNKTVNITIISEVPIEQLRQQVQLVMWGEAVG